MNCCHNIYKKIIEQMQSMELSFGFYILYEKSGEDISQPCFTIVHLTCLHLIKHHLNRIQATLTSIFLADNAGLIEEAINLFNPIF